MKLLLAWRRFLRRLRALRAPVEDTPTPEAYWRLWREKDQAYLDRNMVLVLVAYLVSYHTEWDAWYAKDLAGEDGFRTVLFLDLPTGQVSWHVPDDLVPLLPAIVGENEWDGHTTREKHARIRGLVLNRRMDDSLPFRPPIL